MTDCGLVCVPGAPGTALASCTGCWPRVDTCTGMGYSCDWFGRGGAEAEASLVAAVAVLVK